MQAETNASPAQSSQSQEVHTEHLQRLEELLYQSFRVTFVENPSNPQAFEAASDASEANPENQAREASHDGAHADRPSLMKAIETFLSNDANHPLAELRQRLGADAKDAWIFALAGAARMRSDFSHWFSVINGDDRRRSLTLHALTHLLGARSPAERAELRSRLAGDAPLVRQGWLAWDAQDPEGLLAPIPPDARLIQYLSQPDSFDAELASFAQILSDAPPCFAAPETEASLKRAAEALGRASGAQDGYVLLLHGGEAEDRRAAALHAARAAGNKELLALNVDRLLREEREGAARYLQRALRESRLRGSLPLLEWSGGDATALAMLASALGEALQIFPGPIILALGEAADIREAGSRFREAAPFLETLQLTQPDYALRLRIWSHWLSVRGLAAPEDLSVEALAGRYLFSPARIRASVAAAERLIDKKTIGSYSQDAAASVAIPRQTLLGVCRTQSAHRLGELAARVELRYSAEDLVLSRDAMRRIEEILLHMRYRESVYGAWGFERKMAARGTHALFAGPSGTGKTMSAGVIAQELGLELYRIDLAGVVSKYIGETEKNLSRIFEEAHNSNAILFFDEADALFGKRSEVKDAHDRYANIEVAYLLQKMEEYPGMTILATNLDENLDEAFLRRLNFIVYFAKPRKAERRILWRKAFPETAPTGELDFAWLGDRLELSPAGIQNTAFRAAFFAREDAERDASEGRIEMRHVLLAALREYQKEGRAFLESDLKPYYQETFG